eukprot:TRINITY_DN841_c0_g2_i2.p1 TRINITY_DN841_c0_g2~~TRINITY_DN841_c0_g2_i2.p1  ORF type:complete len:375 (+),score=79.28 TRINITY_DN841_c0_g2_i2:148-1272(+)
MHSDKEGKEYLNKKVNPILEKLVVELVTKRPQQVVNFMITWLQNQGQQIEKSITSGKQEEQSDDSDDDAGEDLLDVEKLKTKAKQQMRTSVSSEAYGKFNKKQDFKPKIVPKSQEQMARIKTRLSQAFMFQSLDDQEQKIVIDAMEEKAFKAGDKVIVQGQDGDNLYVIDKGKLDCFKKFQKDAKDTFLKVYQEGDAFGELALLYNAPRAATIIAKENCVLFSLDRQTFNHIVKDAASKKREKYESFLSKVDLLHDMDAYERLQIADALKTQKYKKDDTIIREGESGDMFYILESGEAKATKQVGKEIKTVLQYKAGDYFGEISLLKNCFRQANVIATTDCTVVYLDRMSFKRLIGPLDDILRRNFAKYEKYMA